MTADECWNTGTDLSTSPAAIPNVQWLLNTADASSNDGLNCPTAALFPPTLQPTSAQPTLTIFSDTTTFHRAGR